MAPVKQVFDYLVLGGGSGGIASARRAASYGARVGLIENQRMGGTCVNVGCVPKKIMWNAAAMAESLHEAKGYGYDVEIKGFDWTALKKKRDAYIERLNGIYERNLDKDQVQHIHGTARFVGKNTVEVNGERYEGKHVLIATGSYAWLPPIPGARELGMTSDGFFDLDVKPRKMAIVGAGYIAVELAGIFQTLGVETHLYIRHEQFLRTFDKIIRDTIMEQYEKIGIKIHKFSNITSVENMAAADSGAKSLTVKVEQGSGDAMSTFEQHNFDGILFAIGRKAQTTELSIETIGVETNEDGFIKVNDFQDTNVPHIHALGDICGEYMLTPVAIAAGRRLSDRLFGNKPNSKLNYENIPSVVFSHPTCGTIGLTEEEARKKYAEADIKIYSSKFTNMYFSMVEEQNKQVTYYKLVCAGPDEKVVGMHIVGKDSDEIMQGFGVAIKMGATKAQFDDCVAIHPTAGEELVTMR